MPLKLLRQGKQEISLDALIDPEANVTPRPSFIYRNRAFLLLAGLLTVAPLALDSIITEELGIPKLPYYVGTAIWTAIGFGGLIFAGIKINAEKRRLKAAEIQHYDRIAEAATKIRLIDQRLDALTGEHNAVRESLLHVGIARGIFPQEYGLR